jgi:hypothetical protein
MTDALKKIEQQALAEIKDYSTGKKYFVSKFQEKVRKSNIKAKKKLIGRGNEGALSGLGAMEENETPSERALEEGRAYRQDKQYDATQLKHGTKIEMEHVKHIKDKKKAQQMAEKTAKDHLDEDPNYYKKLVKYIEK